MKTKTFLLLCLFLGIGLARLSAQQPEPEGTKSVPWDNLYIIWEDLYCPNEDGENEYVGWLFGPMVWHNISHFVNGIEVWEISQAHGKIESSWGEVFKVAEVNKVSIPQDGLIIGHTNLIGNWGNHFVFSMTWDANWNLMSIDKTGCPVNKKK